MPDRQQLRGCATGAAFLVGFAVVATIGVAFLVKAADRVVAGFVDLLHGEEVR